MKLIYIFGFSLFSLALSTTVNACVCFSVVSEGFKESNVILRGYVESVHGSVAKVRVIKVYKGIVNESEIQVGFVKGNGMNCGTNFEANKFETIAASTSFSANGLNMGYSMPECGFDAIRRVADAQPLIDSYYLEAKQLESKAKQQPGNEKLWLNYLARLEEAKDYLRAIEVMEILQKLKPNNLDYQAKTAFWWMQLGKLETSLALFNDILTKDPNNLTALRGHDQTLIFQQKGLETKGKLKDYSEMNLFNIDYSNLDMSGVNFTKTNITYNAKFENTIFNHAQFIDSQVDGSFKQAVFDNVVIKNTSLNGDFTEAKLSRLKINKANIYANLKGAKVEDVDFSDANLSSTDFSDASFKNVNFTKANISNAKFNNVSCDKETKWPVNFDLAKQGINCRF